MWDRLRSPTGAVGAGSRDPLASLTSPPPPPPSSLSLSSSSSSSSSKMDRKGRASTFSPTSQPSNPSNSWQPRSSVIAARQGGQQQRQASLDSGAYYLAGKAGPPPPRPPREFEYSTAPLAQPPRPPYQQHPYYRQHDRSHHPLPRSQTLPAPPGHARRDSLGRPPSSVYSQSSQPSPLFTDFSKRTQQNGFEARYTNSPVEVSPPSSPEMDRARHVPNHDISPIDEEDDYPTSIRARTQPPFVGGAPYESVPPVSQVLRPAPNMSARAPLPAHASLPSQQRAVSRQGDRERSSPSQEPSPRSNIPMMRRERRAKRDAEAAANKGRERPAAAERQDSHESRGPPGRPSRTTPTPTRDRPRGLGISTMASSTPESPETQRARRPSRSESRSGSRGQVGTGGGPKPVAASDTDPGATAFAANRPGWRGPSGRSAIVDPVRDSPEVAPLKIPPRSAKRASPRPPSTEPASLSGAAGGDHSRVQGRVQGLGQGLGQGQSQDHGLAVGGPSPPISPETLTAEQQPKQQMGGGGSAGKGLLGGAAGARNTLANTFRKIIPSASSSSSSSAQHNPEATTPTPPPTTTTTSTTNKNSKRPSRLFSAGAGTTGAARSHSQSPSPDLPDHRQTHQGVRIQGYPSPPLSGSPTPFPAAAAPGGGSAATVAAPVNASNQRLNHRADASTQLHAGSAQAHATVNANHQHQHQQQQQQQRTTLQLATAARDNAQLRSPSGPPTPTPTTTSIRRKEVGSAILVGPFPGGLKQHQPQDSFSSSVYSRPDDHDHDHEHSNNASQPRQPSNPTSTSTSTPTSRHPALNLNTKNLPSLPPGATASANAANAANDANSPYVQPPSRFSITTYATSAHTSSPRESLSLAPADAHAPPLPIPPRDIVSGLQNKAQSQTTQGASPAAPVAPTAMTDAESSVLQRKRPEMRGGVNKWEDSVPGEEPVKISLSKAWMSTAGANSAGINANQSPPRTRKDPPKGPRDLPSNKKNDGNNSNSKESRGFGFNFLSPRSPTAASESNSNSSRPASIMSNMDKDLPPAPLQAFNPANATANANGATNGAPITTHDRIAQLNSQLQDLANRRLNINRAIRQMTELMPQDNLMLPDDVRRKREMEKRKIEDLNNKLADIQREEHDLGMKLHRAYKKLDKQTEYEPTTLWVRRATGS